MNALKSIAVGLGLAVAVVLSSGGAALAEDTQVIGTSDGGTRYEGSTVATYAIVNAWPK